MSEPTGPSVITALRLANIQLCGTNTVKVHRKGKRHIFTCPACGATGKVNATAPHVTPFDLEEKWPEALGKMNHIPKVKA
jgi:hypothetical protein